MAEQLRSIPLCFIDKGGGFWRVELVRRAPFDYRGTSKLPAAIDAADLLHATELRESEIETRHRIPTDWAFPGKFLGETVHRTTAGLRIPGEVTALRGAALLHDLATGARLLVRDLIQVQFHPMRIVPDGPIVEFPELCAADRGQLVTTRDGSCALGLLVAGQCRTGLVIPVNDFLERLGAAALDPARFDARSEGDSYREELAEGEDALFDALTSGSRLQLGPPPVLEYQNEY